MKNILTSVVIVFGLTLTTQAADATVKLSDVHLCCTSCVKGVQAVVGKIKGVTADVDKDEGTVSLTAPDKATLQQTTDALVAAGYFGASSDPDIKLSATTGAKGEKVQSLKVESVHLCCAKCVTAVNAALGEVAGVKTNTAIKGATVFTVTGDFNDKEVFDALHKEGLSGHVGK